DRLRRRSGERRRALISQMKEQEHENPLQNRRTDIGELLSAAKAAGWDPDGPDDPADYVENQETVEYFDSLRTLRVRVKAIERLACFPSVCKQVRLSGRSWEFVDFVKNLPC